MRLTHSAPPSKETLAEVFQDPPAEYGCVDGWWWEADHVVKERLRWQLEELKDKGISGSWFYARFVNGEPLGSDPAYFSDDWWELTRFAAAEHERLGLLNWTSIWTVLQVEQDAVRSLRKAHPQLWGRKLVIERTRSTRPGQLALDLDAHTEILDAAAYRMVADDVDYASRVPLTHTVADHRLEWNAPDTDWVLTAIVARPWDINYLGPEVAQKWNDVILGEYDRRLPGQLGTSIQAFGPDEMMFLDGTTMFSPDIVDRVRATHGYDVTPFLIGLFHDLGPRTEHIRCAYYDAMTGLLSDNFYRPLAQWLHERGMIQITLSVVGRTPLAQTFHYGDIFRYLGSFDIPGNEDPGWQPPINRRLYQSKISSSVAHLTGRSRVIVEAHYGAGWGHTLEENLAWTNAAYAKGLNCYTRHLATYSLMGGWYEWVPPADHFYHPYWAYWKPFADYVRRLSYVMSQGHHRADVALLHPLTTIHANWVAGRVAPLPEGSMDLTGMGERVALDATFDPPAHEASTTLGELATAIYVDGIDFDFVNDEALGSATIDGPVLKMADLEFRSIVLPPMTTISLAVAEVISRFYAAGGTVAVYGRMPSSSSDHGRDDPRLRELLGSVFGDAPDGGYAEPIERTNANGGNAFFIPEGVDRVPEVISRAIVRDVQVSGKATFHTHQKVGDLDVYLLTNLDDDQRDVTVRLRVDADVERWDSHTGQAVPVPRVRHDEGTTELRLRMQSHEGLVLVCSPRGNRPDIVDDDFTDISSVTADGNDAFIVEGLSENSGSKRIHVRHNGHDYVGETTVDGTPEPISVAEPLAFRLEPTMNNQWGDYRYPPSSTMLGAEARRFRYHEEDDAPGAELDWHAATFDDADWPEVAYSYGPYWWVLGPQVGDWAPDDLLGRALRGDDSLPWRQFTFSRKFGSPTPERVGDTPGWEHLMGVSENFIVLDAASSDASDPGEPGQGQADPSVFYLRTTVDSPRDADYLLLVGRSEPLALISLSAAERGQPFAYQIPEGTRGWIDGEEVFAAQANHGAEIATPVHLTKGRHTVLLRLVGEPGSQFAGYAAFVHKRPENLDPRIPLLTWFRDEHDLTYDIHTDQRPRVGWYRFTAPPGTTELRLALHARSVDAWVDGESATIDDGTIRLEPTPLTRTVSLRVGLHPGTYAGAALHEPISLTCAEGRMPIGDWSEHGLATYSGIGVYGIDVSLTAEHLGTRVLLDLGHVKTVADVTVNGRPAGIRLARPFQFDITEFVVEGENRIEVKVANTLANHMSSYPTVFVREGQTRSGLLGPVGLRFLAPTRAVATRRS